MGRLWKFCSRHSTLSVRHGLADTGGMSFCYVSEHVCCRWWDKRRGLDDFLIVILSAKCFVSQLLHAQLQFPFRSVWVMRWCYVSSHTVELNAFNLTLCWTLFFCKTYISGPVVGVSVCLDTIDYSPIVFFCLSLLFKLETSLTTCGFFEGLMFHRSSASFSEVWQVAWKYGTLHRSISLIRKPSRPLLTSWPCWSPIQNYSVYIYIFIYRYICWLSLLSLLW